MLTRINRTSNSVRNRALGEFVHQGDVLSASRPLANDRPERSNNPSPMLIAMADTDEVGCSGRFATSGGSSPYCV